ncbi:MAG: AI-2E family transporter [Methanohalobium sp.]|uniref:AI-2E family transporter n=1 Tax=Methanohalobium sp. TaxID=2837493 RepID=UPI00397936C4
MDSDKKYSFFVVSLILLVSIVAVYLTKEFVPVVVFSIFLTYVLYPVYLHLKKITRSERIASSVSVLSALFILGLCIYLLISSAVKEISKLVASPGQLREPILALEKELLDFISSSDYFSFIANRYISDGLTQPVVTAINWSSPYAKTFLTSFITNTPLYMISFVLTLLFTYYFLIDARRLRTQFIDIIPEKHKEKVDLFIKELNVIYYNLFNIFFVTSFITGVIAAVGFFLLGIPYPVILGMAVFLLTLLPLVGAPVIYGPLFIYYLVIQEYFTAVVLLLFGIFILSIFPDSFIRPRLAKDKASIHPVITLLSFTAPIFVIGFTGFIVGPLVYGFLLAFYRTILITKSQKLGEEPES